MSYFPVLLNLTNKKILLVGGGAISLFKYNKVIEYNPQKLTVVSKKFDPEFNEKKPTFVEFIERAFCMDDLNAADLVIVAVDDLVLQQDIYDKCQVLKIPCNCVDELKRCDFIFPATIKRGHIVIAISSSGKVPGFSVSLKEYLSEHIPVDIEDKLSELLDLRKSLPAGRDRMQRIKDESSKYFNQIFKASSK